MGNHASNFWHNSVYDPPGVHPEYEFTPTFDSLKGFPEGRKERCKIERLHFMSILNLIFSQWWLPRRRKWTLGECPLTSETSVPTNSSKWGNVNCESFLWLTDASERLIITTIAWRKSEFDSQNWTPVYIVPFQPWVAHDGVRTWTPVETQEIRPATSRGKS